MSGDPRFRALRVGKLFAVAATVAFLHFAGQITSMRKVQNRYLEHWSAADSWAIALGIVGVAAVSVGVKLLTDRIGSSRLTRVVHHLFLIAAGSGLLCGVPSFQSDHLLATQLFWLVLCFAVGWSFARPELRLDRTVHDVVLVFSPVVILVVVPMFFWSRWDSPLDDWAGLRGPGRPVVQGNAPTRVFLMIFDEWSYDRATEAGEFESKYPNLRALCRNAVFFRDARSPGTTTDSSIPMLIHGTEDIDSVPWVLRNNTGTVRVSEPEELRRAPNPTIFQTARERGFATAVLGFYLPYRRMLGSSVDRVRSYPFYPTGDGLASKVALRFYLNMRRWTDPVSDRFFRPTYYDVFAKHWFGVERAIAGSFADLVREAGPNTFAFVHWPLPHGPMIFDADGSYRGPPSVDFRVNRTPEEDRRDQHPEDYERQLRYLDLTVGRVVEQLRAAGAYDDSLLILTSDHSWGEETDPRNLADPDAKRHVPLVIKLPREREAHVVDRRFHTAVLDRFVEDSLDGKIGEGTVEAWLASSAGPPVR